MKWQVLTLGEAGAKIVGVVLQKLAGVAISHPATALVHSAIIGVVQVCAGLFFRKIALVPSKRDLWLSLLSGVSASAANVLGPIAFLYGADLAGRTFIAALSIVPVMLFGQFILKQKLNFRQYLCIVVFVFGAWAILNGPDVITLVTHPPTWVLMALGIALTNALNEALRSGMSKEYSPLINNFWVGVSTVVCSFGLFVGLWVGGTVPSLAELPSSFIFFSVITGLLVVVMISMSLLAYQGGALIALKKVFMSSSFLIGAMIAGWLFFDESITLLKAGGVLLFVLAVIMSDNKAWGVVTNRFIFKTNNA